MYLIIITFLHIYAKHDKLQEENTYDHHYAKPVPFLQVTCHKAFIL